MASSLDYDPEFPHYWSEHPRDKVFGANTNAFSSRFSGFSICHPIHGNTMFLASKHAIYSAAVNTEETASVMLLPSWNYNMTTIPYASLCRKYPRLCKFLGTIPSNQVQYTKVPFWNNIELPLSKHSWKLQVIAIWNTKGRVCLNAHNKDCLKELAKEIPEARWEIQNIHNHPYQTAAGSGQQSGLSKMNKLPNDHPQTSEGPDITSAQISTDQPHNWNIDEAPQNSSSQNQIRKVKNWRDWTYTDGSLQKNEVGQDTKSGVYHPHLNVSHYVNPKGMDITNTISRAELAAIAAAVIHSYSHIATGSLTSLHQIKKQLSHPNLHHHHIQGDVVQSINYLCVHFSDSLHRWGKT
jgi:hypothetical protein